MQPDLHKGQLTTWKDDRGFGFIEPEDGGQAVFLHISAVRSASRRPKVGDTILYKLATDANGRLRASAASIRGAALQPLLQQPRPPQPKSLWVSLGEVTAATGGIAAIAVLAIELGGSRSPSLLTAITKPGCDIKGNVSYQTRNRLYHIPGMEDYEGTIIHPMRGERWFCTEEEAIANGWRRAPR